MGLVYRENQTDNVEIEFSCGKFVHGLENGFIILKTYNNLILRVT